MQNVRRVARTEMGYWGERKKRGKREEDQEEGRRAGILEV
jgi:hypothetical protein